MQFDGNAIKELFKIIKAPYILVALSLCSGLILFLPDNIIKKMYMYNFRDNFGGFIGAIFIISLCLLLTLLISKVYKILKNKYTIEKLKKSRIKYLLELDNEKIKIIKKFINTPDHTLAMNYNSGITLELSANGIITQAGATQALILDMETK